MISLLTHSAGFGSLIALGAWLCSGPLSPAIFIAALVGFGVIARRCRGAADHLTALVYAMIFGGPGLLVARQLKEAFPNGSELGAGSLAALLVAALAVVTLVKTRDRVLRLSYKLEMAVLAFCLGLGIGTLTDTTTWTSTGAVSISVVYGFIFSANILLLAASYRQRVKAGAGYGIDGSLLKQTIAFAFPFAISQTGMNLFYIVELVFVGQLSANDMAGAGLATSVIVTFVLFGYGCLVGADTIASQALGADDKPTAAEATFNAFLLSIVIGCVLAFVLGYSRQAFELFGVHKDIIDPASRYLNVCRWALIPSLLFSSAKQFLQIINRPKLLLITIYGANILNGFIGYGLTLGRFGLPRMELEGAALSCIIANAAMALVGVVAVIRILPEFGVTLGQLRFRPPVAKAIIKFGLPAGVQFLVECWIITFMAMVVAQLSATVLAGQSIAMNVMTTAWSAPFGISIAAVIQTGNAIGAGEIGKSVKVAVHCLLAAVCWWIFAFGASALFAPQIIGLYTTDPEVAKIGKILLIVAMGVHLLDCIILVMTAVLRGKAVTSIPLYLNVIANCFIAPPLIYFLAKTSLGVYGAWIGFACGAIFTNVGLLAYWMRTRNKGQSIVNDLKQASGTVQEQKTAA